MSLISSMFVTMAIAQERYAICKQCPNFSMIKTCKLCGCVMPLKVKLRYSECPDGKWMAVEDDGQMHYVDDETWENIDK